MPAGGDHAAGRPLQADDHPRDRGLPGTGLPGDGQRAARLKLEGDIVDGDELAILLAQPGYLQDRRATAVRHRMPGEAGRAARGRGRTGEPAVEFGETGQGGAAHLPDMGTPRREGARPRRCLERRQRLPGDGAQPVGAACVMSGRAAASAAV